MDPPYLSIKLIYSTNHKDIEILYFIFWIWSGIIGIKLSQINLIFNNNQLYNVIVIIHALIIIFFITIPIVFAGFGNWLIPLIIGCPDIYFPRLNNIRF